MINEYLQGFRKSKQLSTEELANQMGISRSLYEKVEYGIRNPSYGFTTKLKALYEDADIDQLVQGATLLEVAKNAGTATEPPIAPAT